MTFVTRHGHTPGGKASRTYASWLSMRRRCSDSKNHAYPRYGGRGIRVCERWAASFDAFLADMGERPEGTSLDRWPDKNGNYEPGNCRWATSSQQNLNMRSNRLIDAFGETLPAAEWARRSGLSQALISYRLDRGWPPETAVSQRSRLDPARHFLAEDGP